MLSKYLNTHFSDYRPTLNTNARTPTGCMCREPDLMMSSFELDRDYEGPSSVGIEMYLDIENNNADASSVSFDPVDMIDPSVLDPITAYS